MNESPDCLDAIFARHPNRTRDELVPILQEIVDLQGSLSREAVLRTGKLLGIPATEIYSVATFYNQFKFQPAGKYRFRICRGMTCHIKNSDSLLETLTGELGIVPGETSADGLFSLEEASCLGACGQAPSIMVNGVIHSSMTPSSVRELVASLRAAESRETEKA